jgi:hypothetical protein
MNRAPSRSNRRLFSLSTIRARLQPAEPIQRSEQRVSKTAIRQHSVGIERVRQKHICVRQQCGGYPRRGHLRDWPSLRPSPCDESASGAMGEWIHVFTRTESTSHRLISAPCYFRRVGRIIEPGERLLKEGSRLGSVPLRQRRFAGSTADL